MRLSPPTDHRKPIGPSDGQRCRGEIALGNLLLRKGSTANLEWVGMGMQFVSLTLTAVRGVAPSETGLASALLNTGQQLGGALGLSVLATVAIDATATKARSLTAAAHGHATGLTHLMAIGHGYTTAFEVAAGIALVGLAISVTVIRVPRPPANSEPALAGVAAAA